MGTSPLMTGKALTLPWSGIDKLTEDELGEELYTRITQVADKDRALTLLEEVANFIEENPLIRGMHSSTQDLLLDYIDDWMDYFELRTTPGYSGGVPSRWQNYSAGQTKEPEPDPYEERFNRIEGQLKAIHDYLRVQATDSGWVSNWADRARLFNKFHEEFEQAGTEAAVIAKAVSDLTEMAAELDRKPKRVVRKKR